MQDLTTDQVRARLAEFERIANGAYDKWQIREARRGIRLYAAELVIRRRQAIDTATICHNCTTGRHGLCGSWCACPC